MTHDDLVERAARWLKNSRHCVFVLTELSRDGESPDAIGWTPRGHSILIECKASRSDFYSDRSKTARRVEQVAIGCQRYYMTPPGLVKPEQVPQGWGLLECESRIVRSVLLGESFARHDIGWQREMALLLNAVRRCYADPRVTSNMRPVRWIDTAVEFAIPEQRPSTNGVAS